MVAWDVGQVPESGIVSEAPLRIYTGILGQIGDVVMFSATVRRLRELFPRASITFAVSKKYREAGELVGGLPYVDRLFVTERYFENLTEEVYHPWHMGWPVDLRGEDEVIEQQSYDIVLETRPRHRRMPWWEYDHQVAELAHMVGVPGPIDLATDIAIPDATAIPPDAGNKIVFHNDPSIDLTKAWPWARMQALVSSLGAECCVLLGSPGDSISGALDLRGRTTLAEAATIIRAARCYVGIDSGLMWIAGSLNVPAVGLYGTSYIQAYSSIHPCNPRATYLQAEGSLESISVDEVQAAVQGRLGG